MQRILPGQTREDALWSFDGFVILPHAVVFRCGRRRFLEEAESRFQIQVAQLLHAPVSVAIFAAYLHRTANKIKQKKKNYLKNQITMS